MTQTDNNIVQLTPSRTSIRYDPRLVPVLKAQHQQLVVYYTKILSAAHEQKYAMLNETLTAFSRLIKAHFLKEEQFFYIYVADVHRNNEEISDIIKSYRTSMRPISKAVLQFLNEYAGKVIDNHNVWAFKQQIEELGPVLSSRIEDEEENLYTLYVDR